MSKSKPKLLGGMEFKTKAELKTFASKLLNKYAPKVSFEEKDAQVLHELFRYHPDYNSKTRGQKIVRFFRSTTPQPHSGGFVTSKVFCFETDGGITDHFSTGKSIDGFWSSPGVD